jgi:hypothetical protein
LSARAARGATNTSDDSEKRNQRTILELRGGLWLMLFDTPPLAP